MIKKRYVLIAVAVVSLLLGSLFYDDFALSKEEKVPDPVEVTNFPLDEEGNVKVTQMDGEPQDPSWKVITVVEDLNVTWDTELGVVASEVIDLGSVSINGYSRMVFFAKCTNYTDVGGSTPPNTHGARLFIYRYRQFEYGEQSSGQAVPNFYWETGSGSQPLFSVSDVEETSSPSIRFQVVGMSITPTDINRPSTISCLVSIGIYLRNE